MKRNKELISFAKKTISSCLFLIATACCYGQTITLKGEVTNETGLNLSSVSIVAKQGTIIKAFDISNKNGSFELTLIKNKRYTIGLSSVGFTKLEYEYTADVDKDEKKFILKQKTNAEDTLLI